MEGRRGIVFTISPQKNWVFSSGNKVSDMTTFPLLPFPRSAEKNGKNPTGITFIFPSRRNSAQPGKIIVPISKYLNSNQSKL